MILTIKNLLMAIFVHDYLYPTYVKKPTHKNEKIPFSQL
jgi:hypothetical protein